ncbi:MAG: glucose-6-phosphate isomerase [candidate division Zixibacteria bacterium]
MGGLLELIGPEKFKDLANESLALLQKEGIIQRIWDKDHTVWKPEPTEIVNRLGWLECPRDMIDQVAEIEYFTRQVRDAGFTHAILLGMGGSSLAPEVFRKVFGVSDGYLDLTVLDSTHPDKINEIRNSVNPEKTLFIVSTKSGGTIETLSFMKYFFKYMTDALGQEKAGDHFVAITDPGSKLEEIAGDLKFRKTFLNDPNIGGRFAALSFFGLVPASLLGVDLSILLDRALVMSDLCTLDEDNPGAWLGVVMGELAENGRDKLTFILSEELAPFGAWAEQLIAESTGKDGKGILPVVYEDLLAPDYYSLDRFFIHIKISGDDAFDDHIEALVKAGHPVGRIELNDIYDLGGEFFRWEMATAVAGWRMGIHPFNQPNVESAKVLAREKIQAYDRDGSLPVIKPDLSDGDIEVYGEVFVDNATATLAGFLDSANTNGVYVAIHAYLKPSRETDAALGDLRSRIQEKYRMAVTVNYGPRFLHSTGQLHKGDGGNGVFIIFTDEPEDEAIIPDSTIGEESKVSFGVLIASQAMGDRQALLNSRRRVIRFHFKSDISGCFKRLAKALRQD